MTLLHPTSDEVLHSLGWSDHWAALLASEVPPTRVARVTRADRGRVLLATAAASATARVPFDLVPLPVTGDWVVLDRAPHEPSPDGSDLAVVAVLPRASALMRATEEGPQALAANVDHVVVVQALDRPLNLRRLERGLVLAWEAGAVPVVVLTKADVSEDLAADLEAVAATAAGVDVVATSTVTGDGLDVLAAMLGDGTTVLVGASGAGKSSLVNALLGAEVADTGAVRTGDGKGRHTTVTRELHLRPGGGALIDTPGLRALGLWADVDGEGIALTFADVEALAVGCRFADCTHGQEPGCAVVAAVAAGDLDPDRLEGWHRIHRELANAELRRDVAAWRASNRKLGRMYRDVGRAAKDRDRRRGR